jgi:hypothetical protein
MLLGCSSATPATKAITVPSSCLSAVTSAYPDNYDYVNLYLSSPGLDSSTIQGLQDDTVSRLSVSQVTAPWGVTKSKTGSIRGLGLGLGLPRRAVN